MRPALVVLLVLLTGPLTAAPEAPDPVLIDRSVADAVPREVLVPAAWAAAAVGTGAATALAVWAVNTAPSPQAFAAFSWATAVMALAAAALDFVLTGPPAPPAPN